MGMFDWYRPLGPLDCPVCHVPLLEWQGKDGQCALYVWQQGEAAPVEQACDEEYKRPDTMKLARLPDSFSIYSNDCLKHWITAKCKTVAGVWCETQIEEIIDLKTRRQVN